MKNYLEKIWKIKIEIISSKKYWKKILNTSIFKNWIPKDLKEYKKNFFLDLDKIEKKIILLEKNILIDKNISNKELKILKKEIINKKYKIEFLKKSYDLEANKLDKNYKIEEKIKDFDKYNKVFFWVTKKDLEKRIIIKKNKKENKKINKEKLIYLLEFSKKIVPGLKWKFWNFTWLAHNNWVLEIPDLKEYNIKRIIAIFFHEMTHYIRYLNWKNNLWYHIEFQDYMELEEWITGYNEYYYWNKIIDYWKYNFYYDKCYQILLKNISEKQKKEEIKKVLKLKWFNNNQIKNYYDRFYRFSEFWSKKLFLKDLIYSKAYLNVLKLLKEDKKNYEKIMAWKIWLYWLKNNFIKPKNNFDSKKFFNMMVKKIKELI